MGIESVDMNKALTSESYAAQCIRSGKLTGSQRGQLAAQWGVDKIKLWESVDSTQYKIDDESWDASKSAGKDKAKEVTGHDGSKESVLRVGIDGVASVGGAIGAAAPTLLGKGVHGGLNLFSSGVGELVNTGEVGSEGVQNVFTIKEGAGDKVSNATKGDKNLGDIATIVLTSAVALKYRLSKPNEDQHKAAMELYNAEEGSGLLSDGQTSLAEAQDIMKDATEQTTALTEEAQDVNEEANENIEDDKTNLDFFRKQYEYLKAKAEGGEKLTPDEKALIQKLAPIMEQMVTDIGDTQENASTELNDKYSQIEGFEGTYDEGAETIAEVQGVTDFAEGFDSATKTMATIEGIAQGLNGASAGVAAGRLAAKSGGLGFWVVAPFVAMGAATAVSSGFASAEQFKWAGEVGAEVDYREATQDLGVETEDVYTEELDNFAGNMEIIDDMELEVPEDVAIPEAPVETGEEGDDVDPLAAGAAGEDVNADDENKGDLENDPDYTGVMGKGSDYSDILTGKTKRNSDDEIVTDANGKVVLSRPYSDAVTSVTGDDKGEGYRTDFVPKILAKLLGDPFTETAINNIKNGGKVDSEFAAKIIKTKDGQNDGKTTVDNSELATQKAKDVINFYWPIFEKAASGWSKG